MTAEQLIEIARRNGIVFWVNGGRQRLYIGKDDQIYGTDPFGNVQSLALCVNYQCSEIQPNNAAVVAPDQTQVPSPVFIPGFGPAPKV